MTLDIIDSGLPIGTISKELQRDLEFLQRAKIVTCGRCNGLGEIEAGDIESWNEICDECLGQGKVYSDDKRTMNIPAAKKRAKETGWPLLCIIDSATGEIVIDEEPQAGLIMRSDGFQFTSTGLIVQGRPTFGQCEAMINRLHVVKGTVQMWLGDLLNYMEERWGETYAQVVDGMDYATGSLGNYQRVARQVPPPLRNEALTYNHYAAVAPLPQEKQAYWLERAVEENLSTRALRNLIHRPQLPPPSDGRAKGVIYYEEGRLEIWCDNGNCLAQIDAIIEATRTWIDWGG